MCIPIKRHWKERHGHGGKRHAEKTPSNRMEGGKSHQTKCHMEKMPREKSQGKMQERNVRDKKFENNF